MKRIFSIFLCAVVIAALFVVPFSVSAAENGIIAGTWVINENANLPYQFGDFNVNGNVSYTLSTGQSYNLNFNIFGIGHSTANSFSVKDVTFTKLEPSKYVCTVIFIDGEDINNETLASWLKLNATKTHNADGSEYVAQCDGTCEVIVHDFDDDGICDDCGMPFTMTLRDTSYNFNGSMLPNIPEAEFMTYGYAIIEQEGEDVYLHFSTVGTRAENKYIMYTGAGNRLTYKLVGDVWTNSRTYTVVANEVITNDEQILWANHDIKDESNDTIIVGDTNFPLPLWMETEKVTQGAIPNFQTITAGNLMTLTLCGVGLITLLVGLYLLLRTFKTYRR